MGRLHRVFADYTPQSEGGMPSIDWGNPLSNGLVIAALPAGVTMQELVSGQQFTNNAGATRTKLSRTAGNIFSKDASDAIRLTSASSQYLSLPMAYPANDNNWTIACIGKTTTQVTNASFFSVGHSANNHGFTIGSTSGGSNFLFFNGKGSGSTFGLSVSGEVLAQSYAMLGRTKTSAQDIWVNGIQKSTGTTNIGNVEALQNCYVGANWAAGAVTAFLNGNVACGFVWQRYLSAAEVYEWYKNPWGIFQAQPRRIVLNSDSGASINSGAASAAGAATATAAGASIAAAAGNSAGTSSATATGAAIGSSVANAAGTATATAVGAALQIAAAAASAAGAATAAATGAAIGAAVANAAGQSTATAEGTSTASGAANAAGSATAIAVGADATPATPTVATVVVPDVNNGGGVRDIWGDARRRDEERRNKRNAEILAIVRELAPQVFQAMDRPGVIYRNSKGA